MVKLINVNKFIESPTRYAVCCLTKRDAYKMLNIVIEHNPARAQDEDYMYNAKEYIEEIGKINAICFDSAGVFGTVSEFKNMDYQLLAFNELTTREEPDYLSNVAILFLIAIIITLLLLTFYIIKSSFTPGTNPFK